VAELGDEQGDVPILTVESGRDDAGRPLIRVAGDLDIAGVEGLREAVRAATADGPQPLTFDLSDLRFMDSAGISVLLGAARDLPGVTLLRPNPAVRRVIELTGLSDVLEVRP
jgi:anti-anti-sigma factor